MVFFSFGLSDKKCPFLAKSPGDLRRIVFSKEQACFQHASLKVSKKNKAEGYKEWLLMFSFMGPGTMARSGHRWQSIFAH
jgi:hypothetical protein